MFNRGSRIDRRNAMHCSPPPYKRGSWELRRNAKITPPPPYNRGPWEPRSNAMQSTPPPYFGATARSQKCQPVFAPMGRVTKTTQQCRFAVALPNHLTGGQAHSAEMPSFNHPHLTTGGHSRIAEMPKGDRSHFIWCRSEPAEMP